MTLSASFPSPLVLAALAAAASPALASAQAATEAEVARLQAEVAAMRAEMEQMRAGDASWMDGDREAETRRIVDQAIAETATVTRPPSPTGAGTRAPIDGAISAGYDGKAFFARAARATSSRSAASCSSATSFNRDEGRDTVDDDSTESLDGFEFRRTKIGFEGSLDRPRLSSTCSCWRPTATAATSSSRTRSSATRSRTASSIQAGLFKLPFAFEELLSSKRQLAADRSLATEFFTLNRAEQIQVHAARSRKSPRPT